jgi:thymidylate synthase ThyX
MVQTQADVFCLVGPNGELLSPPVQATVLAKYSRSPDSAREILSKLTAEEADKFQERYVVGYGHNSVAELATIPVCFEGISIVASKYIESWQRPGYAEKSTRYQTFSGESFVTPPGGPPTMKQFARRFYDAYERLGERTRKRCATLMDKDPNDPKSLEDRLVKARTFDNLRYLLPAGTGTNVAVVMNMLDVRKMICGLRGHSNPEFAPLGDALHDAAMNLCPSLVKHTDPDIFQLPVKGLGNLSPKFDQINPNWYVDLHRPHLLPEPELEQSAFESLIVDRHGMSWSAFSKFMDERPQFAEVPDVFKTIHLTFDIMMDYGAFRDLQRHRRCEQYVESLTANYGYVVPDDIAGSELEAEYREAMYSIHAYDDENVIHDPNLMQYMIPLGYLHRSQFQMDLKELYYVTELRTKPQGHISYRRVAYEIFDIGRNRLPKMLKWCRAINPTEIGAHT